MIFPEGFSPRTLAPSLIELATPLVAAKNTQFTLISLEGFITGTKYMNFFRTEKLSYRRGGAFFREFEIPIWRTKGSIRKVPQFLRLFGKIVSFCKFYPELCLIGTSHESLLKKRAVYITTHNAMHHYSQYSN